MDDKVSLVVMPIPPHQEAPMFIQSIEIEVDFMEGASRITEVYVSDDMEKMFVDVFQGVQMTKEQPIIFTFRQERFKGEITALTLVDSPARKEKVREETGLIFKGTEVIFSKVQGSVIKLKPSKKRSASIARVY